MTHHTDRPHDDATQPVARGNQRPAAPAVPRVERGAAGSTGKAEDIIALLNSRMRPSQSRR